MRLVPILPIISNPLLLHADCVCVYDTVHFAGFSSIRPVSSFIFVGVVSFFLFFPFGT